MLSRSVYATHDEAARPLPGDGMIPAAVGTLTHAITIRCPPRDVWPWLAQMGAGSRAGWYSYDLVDNGGRPSAMRIVPELQQLKTGMVFPALPGATDGFILLSFEPERFLILGWPSPVPDGSPLVTWTFVLQEAHGWTRLIVRARAGSGYSFQGLPPWISLGVGEIVHFVMQRRQLIGIATRAERLSAAAAAANRPVTHEPRRMATRDRRRLRRLAAWSAAGIALAAGAYAAYVLTRSRGRPQPPGD
jgi:hypothetical protein